MNSFPKMRSEKLTVILFVAVYILLWQKGNAQVYYDLYSNNEVYRTKENITSAVPSSIPTQTEISSSVALRTSNYAKIVAHPASPTPMKVPTMAVILALVAVIVVSTVIWLILLVRRRNRSMLRKEFSMTNQDVQLSSTAFTNDPYGRRGSCDSFSIPMPDDPRLTPQISVTSPAGRTTHLEIP